MAAGVLEREILLVMEARTRFITLVEVLRGRREGGKFEINSHLCREAC